MEPDVLLGIFRCKLIPGLIAGDGLVLRSVVFKHPMDVLHPGDQEQVSHKDSDLQNSLGQGHDKIGQVEQRPLRQLNQGGGQQQEQPNGQYHGDHGHQKIENPHRLVPQMLIHP